MQKDANLVELEKCCQTHILNIIFLQSLVLIQPRTSPPNICKILQKKNYQNLIANLIVVLLIRTSKPISPDSSTSPQVPAHDRPPQQLLRPGARARRGGGPGRGRAGAAKDTNEYWIILNKGSVWKEDWEKGGLLKKEYWIVLNNFHNFQNFRQFSNLFSHIGLKKRPTSFFSGIVAKSGQN